MKKKDIQSLREADTKDLQKMALEKRESIRQIRFGASGSKSRNVREAREIRRDVARISTEISKRNATNAQ